MQKKVSEKTRSDDNYAQFSFLNSPITQPFVYFQGSPSSFEVTVRTLGPVYPSGPEEAKYLEFVVNNENAERRPDAGANGANGGYDYQTAPPDGIYRYFL